MKVLKNANTTEYSQTIVGVVKKLDIQYGNIVAITSDLARYMGKCNSAVSILVSEELVHVEIKCLFLFQISQQVMTEGDNPRPLPDIHLICKVLDTLPEEFFSFKSS
ncbi:hypothetical protein PR048_008755 [Dryococelus australis]|uniref:Replication factor A protein 3 n=1 Tax=Dryococelus australis TaxID=614101 RepID=A0ABQ9HXZ8_9NEOP|nr:hypothetical protein PR048_008755 [Dryococelus australis]